MKNLLLVALIAFATTSAWAIEDYQDSDMEFGSGFISVEGGFMHILSAGAVKVYDAPMVDLNFGFSLMHEFKSDHEIESLKIGPKIGFGVGETKGTNKLSTFYDALLKVRYYIAPSSWMFMPFVDGGPGVLTYHDNAFQVEGGAGFELVFGRGTFGGNVQYKEVVGSQVMKRGLTILGALGYHF